MRRFVLLGGLGLLVAAAPAEAATVFTFTTALLHGSGTVGGARPTRIKSTACVNRAVSSPYSVSGAVWHYADGIYNEGTNDTSGMVADGTIVTGRSPAIIGNGVSVAQEFSDYTLSVSFGNGAQVSWDAKQGLTRIAHYTSTGMGHWSRHGVTSC